MEVNIKQHPDYPHVRMEIAGTQEEVTAVVSQIYNRYPANMHGTRTKSVTDLGEGNVLTILAYSKAIQH